MLPGQYMTLYQSNDHDRGKDDDFEDNIALGVEPAKDESYSGRALWSATELIEDERSFKTSTTTPRIGKYLCHLLNARAGLLVAQGVMVAADGMVLLFATCCQGIDYVQILFTHYDFHSLLYALRRSYERNEDMTEPSIKRHFDKQTREWKFDVALTKDDGSHLLFCKGYTLGPAHSPFGRRTSIFYNKLNPTCLDGSPIRVIRDQYCSHISQFKTEGLIWGMSTVKERSLASCALFIRRLQSGRLEIKSGLALQSFSRMRTLALRRQYDKVAHNLFCEQCCANSVSNSESG